MKAVIETGGKQYLVEKDTVIYTEKLDAKEGDKVTFDKVLMLDDAIGTPYVKGAKVEGVVQKQGKQKKITVFKFRAKKKYRRTQGHRQPYTKIVINKVSA